MSKASEVNFLALVKQPLKYSPSLNPPKCPFPWEDPGPHLIHCSLGSHKSTPQSAPRSLPPSQHSLRSRPTHKHRPWYNGNSSQHLMIRTAIRPNNIRDKFQVRWRCWSGGRKGIQPLRNWVVGCWHGYLSGARCRVAHSPADATATHCLLFQ